jgi:tetratricopeptide (TPR) repeat protein
MTESKSAWKAAQGLVRTQQWEPALTAYQKFLELEPDSADGWADLGGVFLQVGRYGEAIQACLRALGISHRHGNAQINLATSLLALGRLEEAEARCRQMLAGQPHCMEALLALGKCLLSRGDLAGSQVALRKVQDAGPRHPIAAEHLLQASLLLGGWPAIRKHREKSLVQYSGPARMYEEAHIRLIAGEMPEGWDLYESRLKGPGLSVPERQFSQPRWNGEPFPGKTLLLHFEGGFGDTVMFVRYAARVKALGGRVLLAAQGPLADLVATCPGVDQVIPHGDPLPPFDLQVSLLSLPQVFRTDAVSIPAEIPYLDVPDRVPSRKAIMEILAASAGKVKIGLVWSGNNLFKNDTNRSLPVEVLAPLGTLPGVAWHSFQVWGEQAAPLPDLVALKPLLSNFSDTAYALSGMDLVLSVDTVLAHLAGAMGIPTLLLLPFQADFRWLVERADSPWYPSLRLYRQPVPGNWGTVIQRILRDLQGA